MNTKVNCHIGLLLLIKNRSVEHDHAEDHKAGNNAPSDFDYFVVSFVPKHVESLKF